MYVFVYGQLVLAVSGLGIPVQAGMWSYSVTTNASQSQITVNIQSKTKGPGVDVLQINSWLPDMPEIDFNPKQKFGVYAEVLKGKAPVLGASVLASIERPQSTPVDVFLHDEGVGADIIKGDGVYAAYIMTRDLMGDGRYNIKVKVIGMRGQTKVVVAGGGRASRALEMESSGQPLNARTVAVENFQRVTSAGEFRLRGFPASGSDAVVDEMPPARITDFRASSFNFENLTATLEWTAVGEDMERGTASQYRIHLSDDFDELLTELQTTESLAADHVISGRLDAPAVAGSAEMLVVKLHSLAENATVFLSVIAVDERGNEGEPSNVVSLSRARDTSVPRVPLDAAVSLNTYLAIAIPTVLALFLVVLVAVALLVIRARKRKSEKIEQIEDSRNLSQSTLSLDLSHMNYMFDGEYRKRLPEDPDTWSKGSI